jgi:hypothetical protein
MAMMSEADRLRVWAVVYGNYDPPEVLALYDNEAAAREHADAQGPSADDLAYEVIPWDVESEYRP